MTSRMSALVADRHSLRTDDPFTRPGSPEGRGPRAVSAEASGATLSGHHISLACASD